ncbi:MAG: hypothetical protein HKO59_07800 [Phycisphaerales bacterium]|nr:hypothetical protein [Phycisphaerae bacterium]NNF43043.1 hypothetical protein [Phycisphaerales bacterium]NNM25878.1 hypothetical protein [Phycisphaerales bacterium]
MFATLSRSWEFAKISYGIIWDFKKLVIFPVLSGAAALAVMASFVLPLWGTGTLEEWMAFVADDAVAPTTADHVTMWGTLFLFYFCSYFVIVFFNSALTACAMKVVNGEAPTVGDGLTLAAKRLPQIAAWAFVSALVGVALRAVENVNEKAGRFVAAILGSAWSALTYFVVPVLVMDGVGPVAAVKSSVGTLKSTWGEALVGGFSMGFLSFLIMLPLLLVLGAIVFAAVAAGNTVGIAAAVAVAVVLVILATAVTSAADVVFKAVLYNYATGRSVPANVDTSHFAEAFHTSN